MHALNHMPPLQSYSHSHIYMLQYLCIGKLRHFSQFAVCPWASDTGPRYMKKAASSWIRWIMLIRYPWMRFRNHAPGSDYNESHRPRCRPSLHWDEEWYGLSMYCPRVWTWGSSAKHSRLQSPKAAGDMVQLVEGHQKHLQANQTIVVKQDYVESNLAAS